LGFKLYPELGGGDVKIRGNGSVFKGPVSGFTPGEDGDDAPVFTGAGGEGDEKKSSGDKVGQYQNLN